MDDDEPLGELRWWVLDGAESVAPFVAPDGRRGIYVLEFADGDRYVGQASDVVERFQSHRHRSRHHAAWRDIIGFGFMQIPAGPMNAAERAMIHQQRTQGFRLRNRVWNLGHAEPSALDGVVPLTMQEHWATGGAKYELGSFVRAATRVPGAQPRLLSARAAQANLGNGRAIWEAVIDELAQLVALVLPSACELEKRFWTLSDCPRTAGGRFATLNVGPLELAYFPIRWGLSPEGSICQGGTPMVSVNALPGTFLLAGELPHGLAEVGSDVCELIDGHPVIFGHHPRAYTIAPVDVITMPLGVFGVQRLSKEELTGVRALAIQIMRRPGGSLQARHHSDELTRLVYQRIVERPWT
jgi:hypothetical protein